MRPSTDVCVAISRALRQSCPRASLFVVPREERRHEFWKPWSLAGVKLLQKRMRRRYKRYGQSLSISVCPSAFPTETFLYHWSVF
jgi:hypothetical protein